MASHPAPSRASYEVEPHVLVRDFLQRFAGASPRVFSAPGRINLIGEHTDYNDGFVLPMAIDRRAYVAARARSDRKVIVRSQNLEEEFEFDLDHPGPPRRGIWGDYVEGTARALLARKVPVTGAELLLDSEVPPGAGLSASAALELSTGYALAALAGSSPPDGRLLALAGQAAEHEYVGTLCGIMDQFISALGLEHHALLIDCRSLEATPVPMQLAGARVVVCDTGVKHQLASSAYNVRHAECRAAVAALLPVLPKIRALRDVSAAELVQHAALLEPVVLRRARHVVTENARTLDARDALIRGDLHAAGALMVASHRSLQHDYEVSCAELDLVVDVALTVPGVYGARMTGGGFGGCAIALVTADATPQLVDAVSARFEREFGVQPELFSTQAYRGAREHALADTEGA